MTQMNLNSMLALNTFHQGMTYAHYRTLVDQLVEQGGTTGPEQTTSLAEYTKLNRSRMRRIEKTFALSNSDLGTVNQLNTNEKWLVLTESWCGDAAQNLPVIHALALALPQVELRLALRDENLPLMDQYLTNGGRSIPKLIRMNDQGQVLGTWGPRPDALQALIADWKNAGRVYAEYSEDIHRWYHENGGRNLVHEMLEQLKSPVLSA
jgi:hypothetical protein